MEIKISALQMELTDAINNYVTERFERLNKYNLPIEVINIHLKAHKTDHHITANVRGLKKDLFSEASDKNSLYRAIDACVDKLEKQIRRGKEEHK